MLKATPKKLKKILSKMLPCSTVLFFILAQGHRVEAGMSMSLGKENKDHNGVLFDFSLAKSS